MELNSKMIFKDTNTEIKSLSMKFKPITDKIEGTVYCYYQLCITHMDTGYLRTIEWCDTAELSSFENNKDRCIYDLLCVLNNSNLIASGSHPLDFRLHRIGDKEPLRLWVEFYTVEV